MDYYENFKRLRSGREEEINNLHVSTLIHKIASPLAHISNESGNLKNSRNSAYLFKKKRNTNDLGNSRS